MECTGGNCIPLSSTGDARVRHFLHWRRRWELHSPNSGLSSCAMTMSSYIALPLETSHWEGLHGNKRRDACRCSKWLSCTCCQVLVSSVSNRDWCLYWIQCALCVCVGGRGMLCVCDDDFLSSVVRTSFTWIVVRLVLFGENVMEKQRKVDYMASTWIGCMPLYHMSIFLVVGGFFFSCSFCGLMHPKQRMIEAKTNISQGFK
jgi:hypothetical protein